MMRRLTGKRHEPSSNLPSAIERSAILDDDMPLIYRRRALRRVPAVVLALSTRQFQH